MSLFLARINQIITAISKRRAMIALLLCMAYFIMHSLAHAETCPTVASIKAHQLSGWDIISLENGTHQPTTTLDNITTFTLAEWMADAPEGEAHCYYDGINVYLAKRDLTVNTKGGHWQPLGRDVLQCKSQLTDCVFSTVASGGIF